MLIVTRGCTTRFGSARACCSNAARRTMALSMRLPRLPPLPPPTAAVVVAVIVDAMAAVDASTVDTCCKRSCSTIACKPATMICVGTRLSTQCVGRRDECSRAYCFTASILAAALTLSIPERRGGCGIGVAGSGVNGDGEVDKVADVLAARVATRWSCQMHSARQHKSLAYSPGAICISRSFRSSNCCEQADCVCGGGCSSG